MARSAQLARVEHVLNRTFRCYFLIGNDPVSFKLCFLFLTKVQT